MAVLLGMKAGDKGEGTRAGGPTIHTPPKKTESPYKAPECRDKRKDTKIEDHHQDRTPFRPARLKVANGTRYPE